jgi:transcriptional regulator GlxA family with amidase domain
MSESHGKVWSGIKPQLASSLAGNPRDFASIAETGFLTPCLPANLATKRPQAPPFVALADACVGVRDSPAPFLATFAGCCTVTSHLQSAHRRPQRQDSGIFLLAETGLFDGRNATVHFRYAQVFAATYPAVPIHPERVLLISGAREELVSSGASSTWHDMVLHLIARYAGSTAAQEVARIFALQWHHDGLTPYIVFEGKTGHGDAVIQRAQEWLSERFSVANPVEEMIRHSAVAERTFKRRFASATGLTPIAYVQRLRVEDAKRRLERTEAPVDEISWRVGYEDPAFFRRLFKRTTGLAPGAYRKRFRIPEFARP